jgi:hypothetical protein
MSIMLNKTPKPPEMTLNRWKQDIQSWIHRKTKSIAELAGVQLDESAYLGNLGQLWSIVTDSYGKAENCADFNAFMVVEMIL